MKSLLQKLRAVDGNIVAAKIVALYTIIAALWIFFSDKLLAALVPDPALFIRLGTYKGWFFVAVTAIMLFGLIQQHVTALRRNSDSLLNQFDQLTTIFDSLNALVYVSDLETYRILYMNSFGTALFGEEWEGKTCYELLQGFSSPCGYCADTQFVENGKPLSPHLYEHKNNLTGRWYQCIDRAIKWTDGRLVKLEVAIDITERKGMEQLRDEMISAVSHEMRTPLTAMIGFTEILLTTPVDAEQQRNYLETIQKESERLNELIGNFLDLQRIKARQLTFQFTPVPVKQLLLDAAASLSAVHARHQLEIDCAANLPPVRGDEVRLHQVLANLITNAVKYSLPGSLITLGAKPSGEYVTLWVRDEGVGIPAEMREMIFDRFFRLDNTDRRMVGGAGLGLALVKEIVTAHEGRVWVESTVGKGSIFYVTLPVMGEDAPPREG
jgi:two-component system, OmpR family, phosphate regulon sensor histidine kinase PhoR